jgi:hypothetical protein
MLMAVILGLIMFSAVLHFTHLEASLVMCICVASFKYDHIQHITITSTKYLVQFTSSIVHKKLTETASVTQLSQGACCFDVNGYLELKWMQLDIHF